MLMVMRSVNRIGPGGKAGRRNDADGSFEAGRHDTRHAARWLASSLVQWHLARRLNLAFLDTCHWQPLQRAARFGFEPQARLADSELGAGGHCCPSDRSPWPPLPPFPSKS